MVSSPGVGIVPAESGRTAGMIATPILRRLRNIVLQLLLWLAVQLGSQQCMEDRFKRTKTQESSYQMNRVVEMWRSGKEIGALYKQIRVLEMECGALLGADILATVTNAFTLFSETVEDIGMHNNVASRISTLVWGGGGVGDTITLQLHGYALECLNRGFPDTHPRLIHMLQLLQWDISRAVSEVAFMAINEHVASQCVSVFHEPRLVLVRDWLSTIVIPWIQRFLPSTQWIRRMEFFMDERFMSVRLKELFDIIRDIEEDEDSTPALEELASVVSRLGALQELSDALDLALHSRLLHPGAGTNDIITLYMKARAAVQILDPALSLEPIRKYLLSRPNTVQCLVSRLSTCEDSVIHMMGVLYGAKAWGLLLSEYQAALARRLLEGADVGVEVGNLELLKIRMQGKASTDSVMNCCKVMVKDMEESCRVDGNIHTRGIPPIVHARIISSRFWPDIENKDFEPPQILRNLLDQYAQQYEHIKGSRELIWRPSVGRVLIQVGDSRIQCNPLEASVLCIFAEFGESSVSRVVEILQSDYKATKKALKLWVNKGLLSDMGEDLYRVPSEEGTEGTDGAVLDFSDDDSTDEEDIAVIKSSRSKAMGELESRIIGLVGAVEGLPLSQVHSLLSSRSGGSYDWTENELRVCLTGLVQSRRIELVQGKYRRVRN